MKDSQITNLSSLQISNPINQVTGQPITPIHGQGSLICASMTTVQATALINNPDYIVGGTNSPALVGTIIFNSDLQAFQVYQAITWSVDADADNASTPLTYGFVTLFIATTTATGQGLTSRAPLVLPTGVAANVEVDANKIVGFMYYATDANSVKVYVENAFKTVTVA